MALDVKFAVSTWLWTSPFNKETVSLFPKIKSYGYDSVEIPVEDPALIDIDWVKNALADNGLSPIICGAFGPTRDLTHEDPAFHQTCFEYLDACFHIASELGAGFVAGPMYSAVGKARLVSPEQKKIEWNRAVTNLQKVSKRAGEFGLEIAIETLNRFETDLINTAEELMQLIQDINEPQAKAILDGFHMNIEEVSNAATLRACGRHVGHVHFADSNRQAIGFGHTDAGSVIAALKDIGFAGYLSGEILPLPDSDAASAQTIKAIRSYLPR